jgi:hypothetical protein
VAPPRRHLVVRRSPLNTTTSNYRHKIRRE